MRSIYVKAASKAAINRELNEGATIPGTVYDLSGARTVHSNAWHVGDVVKVYSKEIGGQPFAKAYGTVVEKGGKTLVK